jgi:hypothetical protein
MRLPEARRRSAEAHGETGVTASTPAVISTTMALRITTMASLSSIALGISGMASVIAIANRTARSAVPPHSTWSLATRDARQTAADAVTNPSARPSAIMPISRHSMYNCSTKKTVLGPPPPEDMLLIHMRSIADPNPYARLPTTPSTDPQIAIAVAVRNVSQGMTSTMLGAGCAGDSTAGCMEGAAVGATTRGTGNEAPQLPHDHLGPATSVLSL